MNKFQIKTIFFVIFLLIFGEKCCSIQQKVENYVNGYEDGFEEGYRYAIDSIETCKDST